MSKRRISRALPIATASTLAWAVACSSAGNAAHDAPTRGDAAVGPPIPRESGRPSDAGNGYTRIDDMEGTIVAWIGLAGTTAFWMTHTDYAQNDSISPVPWTTWSYAPVPTPYETFPGITSAHAARLRTIQPLVNAYGATLTLVLAVHVDAGPDQFLPPEAGLRAPTAVDLTAYKGITFWAKASQTPDTSTVRVVLQDKNTSAQGAVCVDQDGGTANCHNGFGVTLSLTDTFTQYTVDFSALAQEPNWGFHPVPDVPDLQKEYQLFFQVPTPIGASSLTFDLWIDDLYLVNK